MMKFYTLCLTFVIGFSVTAQDMENLNSKDYEQFIFKHKVYELPYRLLKPKNDNDESYPLIIFLHGSGERGKDNTSQLKHGGTFFANDTIREQFPAFVVFPQCPNGETWNEIEYNPSSQEDRYTFSDVILESKNLMLVEKLIAELSENFAIDKNRIYIGGLSLGGMGTFEIVRRNPDLFAAAFPICGAASETIAPNLVNTSWWIFHGADDNVVPPNYAMRLFERLRKLNADVTLSVYGNVQHDSWTNAFAEPYLLTWLFSKSK